MKGFSIIEIILSIALLAIVITAIFGSIIYGQQSTQIAGGIIRATFLAQQGIEAVRNIKDSSFSNLVSGTYYGLAVNNGIWVFSGVSDVTDIYLRQIYIADGTDSNRKIVTSTVTWQKTLQRIGTVQLTTELTNWRSN